MFDEHVQYVDSTFMPDEEQPVDDGRMREVPFQMAAIADVPKEYAIGLVVGPSGSGKTLLLKGRFGYDAKPPVWKEDVAVISQVHEDKEEAMNRLMCMGISSAPDMCRPFQDLSVGQQDCAQMARALGHGAVFDEFGSNLGPVGLMKLCRGLRRFVREHGLGNITLATCNPQVAQMLKPDWTISTGLGTSKVHLGLKVYAPGYWGPDENHRVEGALQAVSSRLMRSSMGYWCKDEVSKLRSDYRAWDQVRRGRAQEAADDTGKLPSQDRRESKWRKTDGELKSTGTEVADKTCRERCAGGAGTAGNPLLGGGQEASGAATSRHAAASREGHSETENSLAGGERLDVEAHEASDVRRDPTDLQGAASKIGGAGAGAEACAHPSLPSAVPASPCSPHAAGGAVDCDVSGRMIDASAGGECEGRTKTGVGSEVQHCQHHLSDGAAARGVGSSNVDGGSGGDDVDDVEDSRAQELVSLEALRDREMAPQKGATNLRIKLECANKDIWPLFKDQHYKGNETLHPGAHVYVATLPDHGNAVVGMVSAIAHPCRGNGKHTRRHRGHWREYRLVVLPGYQGCGIGCVPCWQRDRANMFPSAAACPRLGCRKVSLD